MHDHGRLHPHHRDERVAPLGARRRATALAVLCLCALTAGLDMTITNVALPFIARDLDAPTNELQWTVDAYNIVLAGTLVPMVGVQAPVIVHAPTLSRPRRQGHGAPARIRDPA